jgi:protein TonB
MKAAPIACFLAAVLMLAGFLLFGGLLLFPQHSARKAALEDVAIEEEAKPEKPEEKQAKELEVEKRERPEEAPPELKETAMPLDLSQLEMALNPGDGDGIGGDFAVKLSVATASGSIQAGEEIFSLADLDQEPRVVFQPAPQYPPELKKKKIQGTVHVLFMVEKDGRVKDPKIQKSDQAEFDTPAINAVRRWRFEPGKRNGQPVPFRMRVPLTFAL